METIGEATVAVIPDFTEFDRRVAARVAEAKGELAAVTAAGAVVLDEPSTEELAVETESSAVSNGRTPVPWHSVLAVEGEETEDGRLLEAGSVRWRDLPLTLMGTLETTYGHMGAKVTGRIDSISRIGSDIDSEGEFTSTFGVDEVAPLVADKTVRGVSVDLAVLEWEYRDPDTGETLTDDEAFERWWLDMPMLFVVIDGVILAATVCPMPAIANTEISVTAAAMLSKEQRGIVASALKEGGYPQGGFDHVKVISVFTPFDRSTTRPALFADAGAVLFDTTAPPRSRFEVTEFPGKTPLTITDDGRVFGHIATWDTCHVGIPGVCTTAPRSKSNYGYFHTGSWPIAEGGTIDVGKLMLGTGHAALSVSRESATRHYDKPDMVGAYVRAYDGEFGIWVSGVVRPELSAAGLRELRANPPSGDWRSAAGALELIAVCAVAVPGFPVARAEANIVASAGGMGLSALIASSGIILPTETVKEALVAAGCGCEDMETVDDLLDDLLDA